MPQALLLPLIPAGASSINDRISVIRDNGEWTYLCGVAPIFRHPEEDRRPFRMFTAQLVCQGVCRQSDVMRTFAVSTNSVKRSVKKYREEGIEGFYQPRKRRGATVMTDDVTARAQEQLSRGCSRHQVADQLGVRYDTLRKAINQGRLREPSGSEATAWVHEACDKSQRSVADASAQMGIACTRPAERVLAAVGMLQGAPTRFEQCRDVSFGGVLCALPALAANALFEHLHKTFPSLGGYYTTLQVVTLLAYMALCRIKTVEQLQYEAPGELGKLMGLDRVPEVRCLRNKLAQLSQDNAPEEWAGLVCFRINGCRPTPNWPVPCMSMATCGSITESRPSCPDATCPANDFVCAAPRTTGSTMPWASRSSVSNGRSITGCSKRCAATSCHGYSTMFRASPEELQAHPHRCRFVLVFDREGYSPAFFKEMWQTHRIACITYHKYPKQTWPQEEFADIEVKLPRDESVSMKLAERGSWIGDKTDGLWVREVRKLTASGHQTSLISSAYEQLALEDAAGIFSRWSQENFFRYMMEHYAIDLLSEYQTQEIPGTNRPVVNPRWRDLDAHFRSLQGKLQRRRAQFVAHTLHPETEPKAVPKWERRKGELMEAIEQLEHELEQVKQQRKATPHHLEWDELPAQDKFERLAPSRKRLIDTVKLIAYRAETALTRIVREALAREDDARSLVRDLFRSEADLSPDTKAGVLKIGVHAMANPRSNRAIDHLLGELNAAELTYPGTTLKLVYTRVGVASR